MKKILSTLILSTLFFTLSFSQQKTPTLLKGPADWGFERMEFPLGFAPGINFTGFEEIRFAPGMFDTTSANYFSYAFVMSIDGQKKFSKTDIKDLLNKYFKGLCISVGQPKNLIPDTASINADVTETLPNPGEFYSTFTATLPFFDTFSNGRKIALNIELSYTIKPESNKTYITVLVSSTKPGSEIWNKLHEVKKGITF